MGFQQVSVQWRGIRGLRWTQVLPSAASIGQSSRGSVILVLHAGGNDVWSMRMEELLTLMKADLDRIPEFFHHVVIVWSEIIPRVVWQGARNGEAVERARRNINARMARFVRSRGWVVVRHRDLEGDNRRFMAPDGVHLEGDGLGMFLGGLRSGIEQAIFLLGGGSDIRIGIYGVLSGGVKEKNGESWVCVRFAHRESGLGLTAMTHAALTSQGFGLLLKDK